MGDHCVAEEMEWGHAVSSTNAKLFVPIMNFVGAPLWSTPFLLAFLLNPDVSSTVPPM